MGKNITSIEIDDLIVLIWGRRRTISIRAITFAAVLFVAVAALQYVIFATFENVVYLNLNPDQINLELLGNIRDAFTHPALIFGLAAVHAYLNEGYLPSLLLALAPVTATEMWYFSGPFPGPYVITLKPYLGGLDGVWISYLVTLVIPFATLGFLIGLSVRHIRTEILQLADPA